MCIRDSLRRAGLPVLVLEEAERAGGQIRTLQEEGYTFETGPVSYTHLDVYKRQMHGIWDNEAILQQILHEVAPERTFHLERTLATREAAYDRLAEHMRQHLDIEMCIRDRV